MAQRTYEITIRGTAEPRKTRAVVWSGGHPIAQRRWVVLGAGHEAPVQVQVDAPPGRYELVQQTNVGSNVHEDLVTIGLGPLEHG